MSISVASNIPNKVTTTSRKLPFFEFAAICLLGIFYIDFQIQAQYNIASPFIVLVYLAYCMLVDTKLVKPIIQFVGSCAVVALLYQLLTIPVTIHGSDAELKYFYSNFSQYLLTFFPIVLLYRVSRCASKKQINIILSIIIVFGVILIQAALKFAEINPEILHSMQKAELDRAGVTLHGFSFVYAFTFLIITCVSLVRFCNSKLIKWISIIGLIYCIYFLLTAQFALAFVTTFISSLYLYYITAKHKDLRFLIIIIFVALYFILPYILDWLINLTIDYEVLNIRLREIFDSLTGNHSGDSDLQSRLDLYEKCIIAFFNSPILGNSYLPFNGHSTFLLAFAYLGIFGGLFVCWMFYKGVQYIHLMIGDEKFIYFKPLVLQIILMGMTNPITASPSNFIMLFFVCPLLIKKYIPNQKSLK